MHATPGWRVRWRTERAKGIRGGSRVRRSGPDRRYPGEGLYDADRCRVLLSTGGDDLESVEHPSEIVGSVAGDGQPRAARRSVRGEGGEDDVGPRMIGFTKQIDIAATLFGLHEEV